MQAIEARLSVAATAVRSSVFAELQSRIDAFRRAGGALIPLQIGDTHLAPPDAALAALRDTDVSTVSTYGAVPGLPELRAVLAARLAANGHARVTGPSNVHVGAGCTHALFCAVRALMDPGDEVLVLTPYWPLITGVLSTAGAVPVEVPLTQSLYGDEPTDITAALRGRLSPRTRGLYVTSPNNPDGYVYSRAELDAVREFAIAHDLWVFSDEVYADFVYDGVHVPLANLPGMEGRTVTGHSLSKSHALAGARIGYVSASERVIDAARRIANHTVYNVPVPMQRMAHAAVQHGDAFVAEARALYREARDRSVEALVKHGVPHHVPRGGSFVFVELASRLGGHGVLRALELAVDRGVLLAPGDAFGAAHTTAARLCFTGVPVGEVLRGIERFASALDALALENPS